MTDTREAFEKWVTDEYILTGKPVYHYPLGYIGNASHRINDRNYADINMLYEAWQACEAHYKERIAENG